MSDLIEREAALAELFKANGFGEAHRRILSIAAVDAVHVVRCKDCKWFYKTYNECGLTYHRTKVSKEHFCSYGEKKKDGKTNDA